MTSPPANRRRCWQPVCLTFYAARSAHRSPTTGSLVSEVAEPEDRELLALVERYCAAFENGDMAALTALLRADVKLEMPPFAVWFTGRDAVTRFLSERAFAAPGTVSMVPTSANGQPAVADYRRDAAGVLQAHAIHVLTPGEDGIGAITVFLDPDLFAVFGLPSHR